MHCTVFVWDFGPRYFSLYLYPQTSYLNLGTKNWDSPNSALSRQNSEHTGSEFFEKKNSCFFPCKFTWNSRRKNAEQFFMPYITSVTEVQPTLNFTNSCLFRLSNLIPSKCCLTKHYLSSIKGVNNLYNTAQTNVPKIQRQYFINMVGIIVFNIIKSVRFCF